MDATEFLNAVPDLTQILGDDEDAKQDVFVRLWKRQDSIQNLARYARRAAKLERIDASKRRRREASRVVLLDPRHGWAMESASPIDRLIEAEDERRRRQAVSQLPPRQRASVQFEIDPATCEAPPSGNSHRSNFSKAKARLRELLAGEAV